MSTLSAHVLDTALGLPAAGVGITLAATRADGGSDAVLEATTDGDGRVRLDDELPAGSYLLTFASGDYFAAGDRPTFYPRVPVALTVDEGEHYHVALLLGPWSYTTYRGS